MNLKLALAAVLIAPLALTACAKKDAAPHDATEASAAVTNEKVTPEQQAAIDSLDKPVLDEKNTDVPAEIANAPADEATADTEQTEASAAAH
ncbi:hypothetical protein D7V68_03280 [Acinetobacter cumulans]|uniref:hypothetical protein n=1 Tax=Acinetobacter cumulans TaxID=2136182 RepID=UPI000EA12AF6|nr:hypothetical protein [Acinetobacter cumulans]RKG50932.1 hypothetical protein D7V68_03280 [Acinetobacter cumulans]